MAQTPESINRQAAIHVQRNQRFDDKFIYIVVYSKNSIETMALLLLRPQVFC